MQQVNFSRRLALKGGIAAGSLFLPLPYAWVWAQSEGTLRLLKVPKIALVLGNSKYKEAPLKNPANDAKAIGEVLSATGFQVTLKLDSGRAEMAAAVQAYAQALAASKGVGLFYYAGHGLQLAWRNYMLPVDADIDTVADIQKQGVEVNALLEGLTKAANPMNIIILDACRDNPFGNLKGIEHKGLSQMDAPQSTILAYATSPGNVASDGEGSNGLYTEHLLREVKVAAAKVEDVFKRVRLNVRLKSRGAQIPWESTSLEEDFYFVPPRALATVADEDVQRARKQNSAPIAKTGAEAERQFQEELAVWEKARNSKRPEPVEDYLLRYPSGRFSELAQLLLDQELAQQGENKIKIASSQGNPFTKGSATADTRYKVGDRYTYRVLDLHSGVEQSRFTNEVTQITDQTVTFGSGQVLDLLGNTLRQRDGRRLGPNQNSPLEFAIGRRWVTQYKLFNPLSGLTGDNEVEFRIVGREKITVPAGTFDAFLVVGHGFAVGVRSDGRTVEISSKRWFAPEQSRLPIAVEDDRKAGRIIIALERQELVSFKQS